MCPGGFASSDSVEQAEPRNPSEAVGDPDRRSHQNYARRGGEEEDSETGTEHKDSHQVTAPRPDVDGELDLAPPRRRHPSWNTVLFVLWQPENFTMAHHFLTFVANRSLPILEDTQVDTAFTI